jgi:hypothetical protein
MVDTYKAVKEIMNKISTNNSELAEKISLIENLCRKSKGTKKKYKFIIHSNKPQKPFDLIIKEIKTIKGRKELVAETKEYDNIDLLIQHIS